MKANIDLIMVCAGSQGPADKDHVPLALLYVGTSLQLAGYDVKIWHLLPEEFERAVAKIKGRRPLWVGLSVLSGMTTYHAAALSRTIRQEIPDAQIVWGGHHASSVPREVAAEDYVDLVVIGEGEETAVELSESLLAGKDLSGVSGLALKDGNGGTLVTAARPFVADLDSLEIDWSLIEPKSYFRADENGNTRVAFYSSRGCPYKCSFCNTPSYTGKLFRSHSPFYVERHLRHLKSAFGVNTVIFADDNFMIDRKRGLEIVRRLANAGIRVSTLDVRLNQLNDSVCAEFKEHGVSGIFFGFESGNDRILKVLKKGLTVSQIKEGAKLLARYGIQVWASSIMLVPTETREEVFDTIDLSMWLRDTLPEGSTISNFRYMPLPRTELLKLAITEGFRYPSNTEEWKIIDPVGPYFTTPWVDWLTARDEEFFTVVQELGRAQMLNYHLGSGKLSTRVYNRFVSRMRERVQSRTLRNDFEVKAFMLSMDAYHFLRHGRSLRLKTALLD